MSLCIAPLLEGYPAFECHTTEDLATIWELRLEMAIITIMRVVVTTNHRLHHANFFPPLATPFQYMHTCGAYMSTHARTAPNEPLNL